MSKKIIFGLIALTAAGAAFGVAPPPPSPGTLTGVMGTVEETARSVNAQLVGFCIKTLSAGLILQWGFTYWRELFSGELTTMLAKAAGIVMWGAMGFYALNNQDILIDMFNGYLSLSKTLSGVQFDPGVIWENGVDLQSNLAVGFYTRPGSDNFLGVVQNIVPGLVILTACIAILIAYGFVALSVFVAIAESWMMIAVAPIAIALVGLTAFRDQGMAPLKSIISLGLRIIILGVIIKILGNVQGTAVTVFANLPAEQPTNPVWYTLGGVFACAFFALNAGKLASGIASGSANFSGGDAIKGAQQMTQTTAAVAGAAAGIALAGAKGAASGARGVGAVGRAGASAAGKALEAFSGRNNLGMSNAGGGMQGSIPGIGGGFPKDTGLGGNKAHGEALWSKLPGPPSDAGSAGASGGNDAGPSSASSGDSNSSASTTSGAEASRGGASASPTGDMNAPASVASGDASTAGIGGGKNNGGDSNQQQKKQTAMDHLKNAGRAGSAGLDGLSNDNQSVSISLNTRGE
jgi:type IV secretion system protein TrbL